MGFTTSQVAEHWKSVGGREREHVLPITILSVFMPGPADAAMRNLASRRRDKRLNGVRERERERRWVMALPLKQCHAIISFIHHACRCSTTEINSNSLLWFDEMLVKSGIDRSARSIRMWLVCSIKKYD